MQIASLNYNYGSQESIGGETRSRQRHRNVLTNLVPSQKRVKPRQSFLSDPPLPPIGANGKRPSSIRIKGSRLNRTKKTETTGYSFIAQVPSGAARSQSRGSHKSGLADFRSRSVSPAGTSRPTSRFNRFKFGYPVKLRSADFYGPDRNDEEIRLREELFVNDSIRSAHQSRRESIIPPYEAMSDPHLRRFFQSPVVLDIVRRTMNVDQSSFYRPDDRSISTSKTQRRARTNDLSDYQRIVTKGSSGYGRLNGYDCIPSTSPARQNLNRSGTLNRSTSNLTQQTSSDSHQRPSNGREKTQISANTSVNSFPTSSSHLQSDDNRKKILIKYDRNKPPKPIATSSPLRHPLQQLVEVATPIMSTLPTPKADNEDPESKIEPDNGPDVSQD